MIIFKTTENNLSRISAKDIVYEQIKEKIIKCLLEPGQPIVNEKLGKELEISRTPLREALQRLEVEELVVRNSNGTFSVAPISIKEVKELFVIRSKLEGILIRDAIDNLTEEHIEYLSYLTKMVKLTSRLENYTDTENFGGKFHSAIYSISDNTTVVNIILQLNDRINRYRRLAHKHYVDINALSEEHEFILNYMIKRDKNNAELTIEKHIIDAMKVAVKAVEKYKSANNLESKSK
ncbi:GntR family transcriptional regulator [Sporosarcina sp. ANT_H38]|uniref:GntR family transcriptional regulator n=1 Tax=Sporosarcina sp. ANT_H38 TaxID=2597358 RepID=UPI0011F12DBC|nr:GntR family transcriptional regulator [Sporosarcina sp. ANT_H38]KAA0955372.1 GntR family transcriptional regulator [Sporosarcina sp. ANT_H38]